MRNYVKLYEAQNTAQISRKFNRIEGNMTINFDTRIIFSISIVNQMGIQNKQIVTLLRYL